MRCLWRSSLACSSVVPTGVVMRFFFVIRVEIGWSSARLEAQVAVGQDADELAAVVDDRDARDLVARHDLERLGDASARAGR